MFAEAFGGHPQHLAALIRARLADGSLPRYRSQRTYGGRGDGTCCACCDQPIGSADIQYDVDHAATAAGHADPPAAARTIPMHFACYRLWVELSGAPPAPAMP